MSIGKPVERDVYGVLSGCDDGVCSVSFDEQECIDISREVCFLTDLLAPSIRMVIWPFLSLLRDVGRPWWNERHDVIIPSGANIHPGLK